MILYFHSNQWGRKRRIRNSTRFSTATVIMHRGADKSLARPGRKQANVLFLFLSFRRILNVICSYFSYIYTGCPRRNVPDFGRVFLMLKYSDITQNTYVQSWTVTEIMAREKCGLLAGPRNVPVSSQSYPFPTLSLVSHFGNSADASHWTQCKCIAHAVQVKAALWMVGRLVVRCC